MRLLLPLALLAGLEPLAAAAGGLELAGYIGPSLPFYDQTFRYDPGTVTIPVPGISLRQDGVFGLSAQGALAVGGGLTWYFAGPAGLEARVDTTRIDVQTLGARYNVRLDLPEPFPPISTDVDLGSGRASPETLTPLSLNLKLRTPGVLRFVISGGVSYLPSLALSIQQTVGLGVTNFDGTRSTVDIATFALRAEAQPEGEGESRLGFNAGAGFQVGVGSHVSLVAEGRYFYFRKQTLTWSRASSRELSALEETFLREVEKRLEPVTFNPAFFQATGGIAVTF